ARGQGRRPSNGSGAHRLHLGAPALPCARTSAGAVRHRLLASAASATNPKFASRLPRACANFGIGTLTRSQASAGGRNNDGKAISNGPANRTIQVLLADGRFGAARVVREVNGAILSGVRGTGSPAAECRRPCAFHS